MPSSVYHEASVNIFDNPIEDESPYLDVATSCTAEVGVMIRLVAEYWKIRVLDGSAGCWLLDNSKTWSYFVMHMGVWRVRGKAASPRPAGNRNSGCSDL